MLTRTLLVLSVSLALTHGVVLGQQNKTDDAARFVVLEMTGRLAAEYGKLAGSIDGDRIPNGLHISTTAIVAQRLDDGRIRIEHTMPVMQDGAPIRLVTLTATVDATAVKTIAVPGGIATYTSPGAHKSGEKPTLTKDATKQVAVELADLKGVKLRSWTLANEVGE
ncbi:MAG: hypothetical protein R3C59_16875 [Planctomycetaceae bacterium]